MKNQISNLSKYFVFLIITLIPVSAWAGYSVKCWFGDKPVSEIPGEFRYESYADHPGPISGKVLCYQGSDKKRVAKEYEVKNDKILSERFDVIDEDSHERSTGLFKYTPPSQMGISVGKHQTFNEKGQLITEQNFDQKGEKQGLQKSWDKEGSLKNELRQLSWYENDMTLGSVSFVGKNPDGKLKVSALLCAKKKLFPEHDQFCGLLGKTKVEIYRSWLSKKPDEIQIYEKGNLLSSEDYQEGKLVASQSGAPGKDQFEKEYHQNGKLKRSAAYKAAEGGKLVLDGEELEFSEEGTKLRSARFKMGEKQSEDFWYENSEIKERTKRKQENGKWIVERLTYNDQGKLKSSGNYMEEKEDANWNRYYFSNWIYEKPIGVHKSFDEGKLIHEETYSEGIKTEEKTFNEKGQITQHFKVFKDGSRKSLLKK